MPIKHYNPTTPGRRQGSVLDYKSMLTKFKPERSLTVGQTRANGRNHHGVITAKHRGGGNKRLYRVIDFRRTKDGVPATVKSIEYDPNRSCFIALIEYTDGEKSYILAPNGLNVGQTVINGPDAAPEIGNCLPLTHGIEAAREIASGVPLGDVSGLLATEALIGLAYATAAYVLFRVFEAEGRRRASLETY